MTPRRHTQPQKTAPARAPVEIGAVVAGLAARAGNLARELLPRGIVDGVEWRCGSLAGEPGRSLAVRVSGDKAGVWCDFATGEGGDALDLVAACLYGGDKKQALRWAISWLGLAGDGRRMRTDRSAARAAAAAKSKSGEDPNRYRGAATRIWLEAQAGLKGTLADQYLKLRGIDLSLLGRQPGALRFHPALLNKEADRRFPAMVAAIHGPDGKICACHRTWLSPSTRGVVKADLRDAKMTLGRYRGGAIRIWRGVPAVPIAQAAPGSMVALTEGIEDALTVALARPELRVMAAVSLGNLGHVALPKTISDVLICADNDPEDSKAAAALDKAVRAHMAAGRRVRVARAPGAAKDFNAMLTEPAGDPSPAGAA